MTAGMYLSRAILKPKQIQAYKNVFLLKCMLEDGLVVPATYRVMCKSRTIIDVLKTELDNKILNLSNKKSEIGDVEIKNIVLSRYLFVVLCGERCNKEGLIKNLKLCSRGSLESGVLIEMEGSIERFRYFA